MLNLFCILFFVLLTGIASANSKIQFEEGLTPQAAQAVYAVLKHKLTESFISFLDTHLPYKYPNFQITYETNFKSADVNLGLMEPIVSSIVWLNLPGHCGSGGCQTSFLIEEKGKWREVLSFFGACKTIRILNTGSHGYRDIITESCRFNKSFHFRFDGEIYKEKDNKEKNFAEISKRNKEHPSFNFNQIHNKEIAKTRTNTVFVFDLRNFLTPKDISLALFILFGIVCVPIYGRYRSRQKTAITFEGFAWFLVELHILFFALYIYGAMIWDCAFQKNESNCNQAVAKYREYIDREKPGIGDDTRHL